MPNGMQSAHWGGPWASHALTILLQDLLGKAYQCSFKPRLARIPNFRCVWTRVGKLGRVSVSGRSKLQPARLGSRCVSYI